LVNFLCRITWASSSFFFEELNCSVLPSAEQKFSLRTFLISAHDETKYHNNEANWRQIAKGRIDASKQWDYDTN